MTAVQTPFLAGPTIKRSGSSVQPLSSAEYERAVSVASRLHGEIAQLTQRLGDEAGRPRALARRIDADFSLCQRVLAAIRVSSSSVDILRRLPGVEGLRIVVSGMVRAVDAHDPRHPALAAVEKFEELIRDLGGSHARLIRRIEATGSVPSTQSRSTEERLVRAREQMFASAIEFTGKVMDLCVDLVLLRPLPDHPGQLEGVTVSGRLGLRCESGSVMLINRSIYSEIAPDVPAPTLQVTPLGAPFEQSESGLLEEFSSRPLPSMTTERVGGSCRTVIDVGHNRAIDLVVGRRWCPEPDPRLRPERVWSNIVGIMRPTRHLLTDIYLHESLAAGSIPVATAAIANAGMSEDPAQNWDRQLPGRQRLEVLGPGLLGAATPLWSRHAELTRWVFAHLGWDAAQFVGYRMEEAFPVWGTSYMMSFRYPEQPDA